MKFLAIIATLVLSFSLSVQAENSAKSAYTYYDQYIYGTFGMSGARLGIGAEYERRSKRTHGFGGYFHFLSEDDEKLAPSIIAFGAFVRPHFHRGPWDFFVSPGFGVHMVELGTLEETVLGPSLELGLTYQFSEQMAIGVEHMNFYQWFGDWPIPFSSTLQAKLRYGF